MCPANLLNNAVQTADEAMEQWGAKVPWQQGEEDRANHHLIVVLWGVRVTEDDDHLHDPASNEDHEAQVDCCAGLQPSIGSHNCVVKDISCTWSACTARYQGAALFPS